MERNIFSTLMNKCTNHIDKVYLLCLLEADTIMDHKEKCVDS